MQAGKTVIWVATVYLIICFLLSLYAAKRSEEKGSSRDFYVGRLSYFVIFFTAMATAFSAFAFMGQLGQVYNFGSSAIFNFMFYGIFTYPLMFLIGSRLWYYGRKYGYITPADFLVHRYEANAPIRVLVGLIICIYFSIFYIVIQMQGCGFAIQEATGVATPWAILYIAIFLAAYTAVGGMRAVAYTDVFQAFFMLGAAISLAVLMIIKAGGLSNLYAQALAIKPAAFNPNQNMAALISGGLVMGLSMPLWPALWVRYYASKDLRASYGVATGCGLGTVLITVGLPLILVAGLIIAYPNWPAKAADRLIIRYALDFTNPVLASIVVGGLLAAAMSTADSLLLLISSNVTVDLMQALPQTWRSRITERTVVNLGRIMMFVIIGIAYWVSLRPMGLLVQVGIQLTYPGYLLALPVVVGGLWWRRANKQGAIAGLVVGLIVVYLTTFVSRNPLNIASGIWGLVACTIVFVVVSLLTPPTRTEVLAEFGLVANEVQPKQAGIEA